MPDTPVARSYDQAAQTYEQARPGWPLAAIDHVARDMGLKHTATVLDLGAGTGKLTRVLVERFDRVVAVEPLDGMRRVLESVVPQAEGFAGRAEQIPLPDASVDAVFSGDAFHWFDGEQALVEITRVLRPRGGLVLAWNVTDKPTEPSIAAAGELLSKRGSPERQAKRFDSGEWREPFARSQFEELREARFDNPQVVDREGIVAFFASMSWIAVLPDDERNALLEEAHGLLDADAYTRFWRTELNWTRLAT